MNEELAYLIQDFYTSTNSWMKYQFKYKEVDLPKLTLPQFKVMCILHKEKICNMSHLSELMEVSRGTMTTMLKKLVEDGYVKRSNSYKDRRTVFVELTEEGIKRVTGMQDKLIKALIEKTSQLDKGQQLEIISSLLRLNELIKLKK